MLVVQAFVCSIVREAAMDTRDSVVTAHHGGELDLSFGEQGCVLLLKMEDGQAKALSASFTKSRIAGYGFRLARLS